MEQKSQETSLKKEAEKVEIIYYTDPLCCWSWAFENSWRLLKSEFKNKITYRYRMGGLIADWNSYRDPMNSISRPSHMGPLWMEAGKISGVPICEKIWIEDPPSSSYPSCISVKCAELQSSEAAEEYLRCLREAVMLQGKNIAKKEILLEIAYNISLRSPQVLSYKDFEKDLLNGAGLDSFRQDLEKVRYYKIGRFPTLTMKKPFQSGVIITGYRPYKVLCDALTHLAPELSPIAGVDPTLLKCHSNQHN